VEKVGAADNVGDEVDDREEVRCIGLRATGGGAFFDVELVVEVDSLRSEVDGGSEAVEVFFKEVWERFFDKIETVDPDGLKGGGRVRVPLVEFEFEFEFRGFGGGGATDLAAGCRGPVIRGTVTQSGSSVGMYGFDGRLGFGIRPCCGGLRADRAGCPLSSHHFLLSELAGGKPASIESYPIKSSSSVSSF
jgi:hypothetical protein